MYCERSGQIGSTTRLCFHQLVFGPKIVHGKIVFFQLQLIHLFIMRKDCSSQMVMAMEKDPLRVLPWYQCFMRVHVGPTSCAPLMNCYSSMNLVSEIVGYALNLPLIEHPEPYELWWKDKFYQDHASRRRSFTLCGYGDLVVCDVLPMHMHVCSILLGKSWMDMRQLTYHYDGEFSFVRKGRFRLRSVISDGLRAGYVYLGGRFLCRGIVYY